jgi:hypothetical protein
VDLDGFGAGTFSFEALFSAVVPLFGFATVVALLEALLLLLLVVYNV